MLGPSGWGILTIDNYSSPEGREFESLLSSAASLAHITTEPVTLADAPHGVLPVPPMKEDPRDVSLEEKTGILGEIESSARLPGIVNTRATYIERAEQVSFIDSSANEYSFRDMPVRVQYHGGCLAGRQSSRWGMSACIQSMD